VGCRMLALSKGTLPISARRLFNHTTSRSLQVSVRSLIANTYKSHHQNHLLKLTILQQIRHNSSASLSPKPEPSQQPKPDEPEPKKPQSLWKDIGKLVKLAKPEYKIMAFALICLIITSSTSMSLPLFIGKIIDTTKSADGVAMSESATKGNLIWGLEPIQFYCAMGVLFTAGAVANFGRVYLLRSAGERLVARLRSRLFLKILSQDSYFFDVGPTKNGMKTGDLISRLSSDTQVISKTLSGNVSDGARSLISGMVGLSMMCFVSWKLTLCMSLIFPPLIVMSLYYGRKIKVLSRLVQENLGSMTKVSEEKLNGLKTIQSFSMQRPVVHDYNKEIKNIFNTSMQEGKLSGIYFGGNGFLGNISIVGLLVAGTQLIGQGELSIGDLSSFMMYAIYTGSSVFGLGNFYTELMKGIGAAERIFELIELKPTITTSMGKKVSNLYGDINFDNVSFQYPSRMESTIFKLFNLRIKEGENICFVGPSGSGKSTISQLLMRFYDPIQGNITINGHDIKNLNLNYFRSKIGYVQQEPLLFSGTIRENILFGKEDATDAEIDAATRLSNSYNFISELPLGFNTVIGPSNSTQLSGGQKQRISLARTLIRKPKLIILDEATSALDSISEELVMKNLGRINREEGVTIISIAHRLSTIKNSSRIVVLNSTGNIVEDGEWSAMYSNPNSELNRLLKSNTLE